MPDNALIAIMISSLIRNTTSTKVSVASLHSSFTIIIEDECMLSEMTNKASNLLEISTNIVFASVLSDLLAVQKKVKTKNK